MARTAMPLDRLLRSVRWGLAHALGPRDMVPMLEHLLRTAPLDSAERLLAQQHLARRLVSDQPWRAARLAAEALRQGTDEETHVTLGIALTVLGHYRAARAAYRRGLAHHPASVSILHNLGHLLDVAFERPDAALPYLRAANALLPGEPELAASYAHALGRVGQVERARSVLREALGVADGRADRLLDEWLAGPPEAPPPGSLHAAEA